MRLDLRHVLTACLAVLALALAACGNDSKSSGSSSAGQGTESSAAAPATTSEQAPSAAAGEAPKVSGKPKEKPAIAQPQGEPPAKLTKVDIVKGTGKTAKPGDNVSVQYVGINWSNGAEFDASWNRGAAPFTFTLGAGNVIPGWDQGVKGMKVGGRRELVIPPDLGYGAQGTPDGSIPPNETLVFVVDLEKVESAK